MSATLNGLTVTSARVQIPRRGVWWADVEVSEPDPISGAVTLVVGETSMIGTVVSGGAVYGRGRWRVAGGAGRWGETLASRGYNNDAGVKVQTVLADAARECGESLELTTQDRLGSHWTRTEANAARCFDSIGVQWRVDIDGVTRVGLRTATDYSGDGVVSVIDSNTIKVAVDDPVGLVPGVVVGGITAADVEIEVTPKSITVWCFAEVSTSTKGFADAFGRLVARSMPDVRAFSPWEYRVVSQTGQRLTLQPAASRFGLPDLSDVFVRPGAPGTRAKWRPGSLCVVQFVNGSFSKPVVSHADDPDSPGWLPEELHFEAADQHVKLVNSVTELGDKVAVKDFVALAAKVDSVFSTVRTWLNTHTHPTAATGPVSPPSVPLAALTSTAATHVKAN